MVPALVVTLLLAAPPTYETALRAEGAASPDGALSQLNPTLSLTLPMGHFSLLAVYTPRIVLFDPLGHHPVELLNRFRLVGALRFGRATKVTLEQQVIYGTDSWSWLVIAAEGTAGIAPQGQPVFGFARLPPLLYFSESTGLSIEQALASKLALTARASYEVARAANDEARALLPDTRTLRLGTRLEWTVRSTDSLSTAVDASIFSFSIRTPGAPPLSSTVSYLVNTDVGWHHSFSRLTTSDIAAGVSVGREGGSDSAPAAAYPYVSAGLRRVLLPNARHYLAGSLSVTFAPYIDPLSGQVYTFAYGFATIEYLPTPKFTLAASGGGTVAPKSARFGQQLGFAGLSIGYQFNRHLGVSSGARGVWFPNEQRNSADAQGFHWVAFAAVTVSTGGHF